MLTAHDLLDRIRDDRDAAAAAVLCDALRKRGFDYEAIEGFAVSHGVERALLAELPTRADEESK